MKKIQSRFGEVEYDPEKTIYFPQGMIGFEDLRQFVVIPAKKAGPLFWIQSVDDPEIAFVVSDPTQFFLDYQVGPDKAEREKLQLGEADDCFVLSVVTISPERQITFNLAAPLLYAPSSNRAIQVILENGRYSTRVPLPSC